MKTDIGLPPLALPHPALKNEMFSIDCSYEAERVRESSLRTLNTDPSKGAIGRVPRGYKTIRVPEIPLLKGDIVVHPAARDPFAYFQRFIASRHVARGLAQVAPPQLEFICEDSGNDADAGNGESRHMEDRFLVGGFHQVALLSKTRKLTCRVADREFACDADIEDYAWQQALLCEPLTLVNNKAIAARFHFLQQHLPERLVDRLLAKGPTSARGTRLTTESLCRAYRLPSDSIRGYMPVARRGGMATHTYTDHIVKKDTNDE